MNQIFYPCHGNKDGFSFKVLFIFLPLTLEFKLAYPRGFVLKLALI